MLGVPKSLIPRVTHDLTPSAGIGPGNHGSSPVVQNAAAGAGGASSPPFLHLAQRPYAGLIPGVPGRLQVPHRAPLLQHCVPSASSPKRSLGRLSALCT